jgi:DNA repair exonuclease SbcCD nuclease subunit
MAKIGIIGDAHISSSFSTGHTDPTTQLNSRLLDFIQTFDTIIDTFESRGVKVVVLTGDLYHSRSPSPVSVNALSKSITRATKKGLEVVLISGNHDLSKTTDSTTIDVFDSLDVNKVSVYTKFGVKAFKDFNLILMPYIDRKILKVESNEEAVSKIRIQVQSALKSLKTPSILIGHAMFENTVSAYSDSENFSLNEIAFPIDTFAGCAAVVFGHVHTGQVIQKRNPFAAYVGSMEKITFGDSKVDKSTILYDTATGTYELIPTKVRPLLELAFDYTDAPLKTEVNDRIVADIEGYIKKQSIEGAIVRLAIKVNSADTYHINQERLKEKIMGYKPDSLTAIQLTTNTARQLRDTAINEAVSAKTAFQAFVKNLNEPDAVKKQLLKVGEQIIEDVGGK